MFCLGQPKSIKKTLSKPIHSNKVKNIQGQFKDLHRNIRTLPGKMEFNNNNNNNNILYSRSIKLTILYTPQIAIPLI